MHNHWTASISSLGALAPHEFFKLEILVYNQLCSTYAMIKMLSYASCSFAAAVICTKGHSGIKNKSIKKLTIADKAEKAQYQPIPIASRISDANSTQQKGGTFKLH